jgi:hypothetical protein
MPNDLERADFYLSDETKDDVPAAVALDLLLGAVVLSETADQPPAMFDNLDRIRADYEKSLADYQADRTQALNTLTTASFFGGLGLVLLVAMLGLMRIVSGMHLWIAAIGATTCCLILGAILMDPGRLATGQQMAVPFSSYSPPSPAIENPQPRLPSRLQQPGTLRFTTKSFDRVTRISPRGLRPDLPENLYWNPLLITGPDGKASISFKLPDAASTFGVTIDAHGDGRIGFGRAEIVTSQCTQTKP